jgi:hypothetical protein
MAEVISIFCDVTPCILAQIWQVHPKRPNYTHRYVLYATKFRMHTFFGGARSSYIVYFSGNSTL